MSNAERAASIDHEPLACAECECEDLNGAPDAKFCSDCGHAAARHEAAPATSACTHGDCECNDFHGDVGARFCSDCGHPQTAHEQRTTAIRHLRVVEKDEEKDEAKDEQPAPPAASETPAPVIVNVHGPATDSALSTEVLKSRQFNVAWLRFLGASLVLIMLVSIGVYGIQWRSDVRSDQVARSQKAAKHSASSLTEERKRGATLDKDITIKQHALDEVKGEITKLRAGPKQIGSVANAKARRANIDSNIKQLKQTLASADANAAGATGAVRSW